MCAQYPESDNRLLEIILLNNALYPGQVIHRKKKVLSQYNNALDMMDIRR